MFKIFVLVNGRVVADREFFGSAEDISRTDWEEIIENGVTELRERRKNTDGQLQMEFQFEEVQ